MRDHEHDGLTTKIIGGVSGALIGGALGGVLTARPQGVVAGAIAGAAVGGLAATVYLKVANEEDDTKRLHKYASLIDGDITQMDGVQAAATASLQCYDREFMALIRNIKARKIDRQAAQTRFSEIMSGREEATQILGSLSADAQKLHQQYQEAFQKEEKDIFSGTLPKNATPMDVEKLQKRARNARTNRQAMAQAQQKSETLLTKSRDYDTQVRLVQEATEKQSQELREIMATFGEIRA